MPLLSATALAKRFKSTVALRDVSFDLFEGEVLALLGRTGAGKSTTLRCLAGLEKPESGRILLDGRDVTKADPRERDVAVVFEGFNLLPPLSVADNIAFPLRSPVYREPEDEVHRRLGKAAEDLRISHLLDRRIDQLSGGERQRVAIARALVRKPRVLLLDEPLSALDLKLREALQNELKEMHRTHGSTVIYASHDFPSVAQIATRLALIDGGRILQTGPLGQLLAEPANREVGQLIGSPSMALFDGRIEAGGVVVSGYGPVSISAASRVAEGAPVTLGLWPEDIEVSDRPRPSHGEGRVYATDFRGRDKALEVRFGKHRFRKAVELALDCGQNDPIWFRIPGERAYLFDPTVGVRLDSIKEAAE